MTSLGHHAVGLVIAVLGEGGWGCVWGLIRGRQHHPRLNAASSPPGAGCVPGTTTGFMDRDLGRTAGRSATYLPCRRHAGALEQLL